MNKEELEKRTRYKEGDPKILFVLQNPYNTELFGQSKTSKFLLNIIKETNSDNVWVCNAILEPGFVKITEETIIKNIPGIIQYIDFIKPEIIISFGSVANSLLTKARIEHEKVPHPSYIFRTGMNLDSYKMNIIRRMKK